MLTDYSSFLEKFEIKLFHIKNKEYNTRHRNCIKSHTMVLNFIFSKNDINDKIKSNLYDVNKQIETYTSIIKHPSYADKPKEDRIHDKKQFWENIHLKKHMEQRLLLSCK